VHKNIKDLRLVRRFFYAILQIGVSELY